MIRELKLRLPEVGTKYTCECGSREHDHKGVEFELIALHVDIDENAQRLNTNTVLLFRDTRYPLGDGYYVPSRDCDHEQQKIGRCLRW